MSGFESWARPLQHGDAGSQVEHVPAAGSEMSILDGTFALAKINESFSLTRACALDVDIVSVT